jgi:hypothetical membrane protein
MNAETLTSWWWLASLLATYPLAYYGGYFSSIRKDSRERRKGYAFGLVVVVSLILIGVFTPETPNGFGLVVFIIWVVGVFSHFVTSIVGWDTRREKSLYQEHILL